MNTSPIGQFQVKPRLTANRRPRERRYTENTDYAGFVTRVLRAHGRRVAEGDIEALTELSTLSAQLDQAITEAITGLRATGYSWSEIAARLGITKQAAHQRWGKAA
jgi:DNA-directed RNA polymerase specialized sigma24 family protein